jgi:hypothetical protein
LYSPEEQTYARLLGMRIVRIANPVAGGKTCTSGKRAARFYRQGRADVTEDLQLFFMDAATVVARREVQRVDAEIEKHRSGIVFWNGSDRNRLAMHRPGEARS